MSASPWVLDVTEENFERDVLDASAERPIVIDFWAEWCGPCRALGPLLERLVHEREGRVVLAKINTDDAPNLARAFGISGIPAVKVIYNRQLVHEFEGLLPEPALRQFLDEIAPVADPALTAAKVDESSDPAAAEKRYRDLIEKDPENLDASVGLARVLFAQGRLDEVAPVLEPVGSSGQAGEEADRILAMVWLRQAAQALPDGAALSAKVQGEPKNAQARLELGIRMADQGHYPEALAMLLAAAELDFKLAAGKAREAMVKVFYCLGANHPLANDYRARLSRLLY